MHCLQRVIWNVGHYSDDDADKQQDAKISSVTQKSYGYDAAGRTTSVVSSAGTTTLAYDYEGRISQITYPSTATNTFAYNGLDTRVSKVDSAGTSTYKRDGAGVTAPVLNDGSATYTPGISERRSSTTTFLHSGLKNADSQTGTGQTIAATKQYDAFGNVLSSTGTWKGPFGYAGSFGYQEDADSSLRLLGHRYYDPSTGRFMTRDPIKDGRNWYTYCDQRVVSFVDPNGESYISVGLGAFAQVIAPGGWIGLNGLFDPVTGDVGASINFGGGPGAGIGGGIGPGIGYSNGKIKDGWTITFSILAYLGIGDWGGSGQLFFEPGKKGGPAITGVSGGGSKWGPTLGGGVVGGPDFNRTWKLFNAYELKATIADHVRRFFPFL